MTDAPLVNIPTHVIAGPLGAGKTSVIRHLLTQRPPLERWAVLINEFGQVGIDAALLETGEDGITVAEIPGGCLCCVNGVPFQVGLGRLLRRARPDRLLIEASGLGHPAPLMSQLTESPWNKVLRVHPLTMVLDAGALTAGASLPATQIEALAIAGLVVMNKAEGLDTAAYEVLGQRVPHPRKIWCSQGRIALSRLPEVGSIDGDRAPLTPMDNRVAHAADDSPEPQRLWLSPGHWQRSQWTTDSGSSIGWVMSPTVRFEAAALDQWLRTVDWHRAKGVVNTAEGWMRFNAVVGADVEWACHTRRRDNRIELISDATLDGSALEAGLRDTVRWS